LAPALRRRPQFTRNWQSSMTDNQIIEVACADWQGQRLSLPRESLVAAVEDGKVLYFPKLSFDIGGGERALLDPALADPARKNISLDASGGAIAGVLGDEVTRAAVRALVLRFQAQARTLVAGLFPEYEGKLRAAPTSLRLARVETRQSSWRKDDSRLHIDAFPSRPNRGERILRVFANVNPHGEPRVWRVGEPFGDAVRRFLPRISRQKPGSAALLRLLRVTKSRRSEYDHIMLGLHDAMKADADYQKNAPQQTMPFVPGSVWICFSDQTSHAVMSGQFMLEQTFFLPAAAMVRPERAPLGILESMTGRTLVR
jgi:hypothetical protein